MRKRSQLSALLLLAALYPISGAAQTAFQVLHSFACNPEPCYPGSSPILLNGVLYGTSVDGGAIGWGTVYRMDLSGDNLVVLHDFAPDPPPYFPAAQLIQGSDGLLYGTAGSVGPVVREGAAFRLDTEGNGFELLRPAAMWWGWHPSDPLLEVDGMLFGIDRENPNYPGAVIFKMDLAGNDYYAVADVPGGLPPGPFGLVQASDGYLYGGSGGSTAFEGVNGGVFKLDQDGNNFAVTLNFSSDTFGSGPWSCCFLMMQAEDGLLYGTTWHGGAFGFGSVFRVSTSGDVFELIHSFRGNEFDGSVGPSAVVQGVDGALYGTTLSYDDTGVCTTSGSNVFRIDPSAHLFSVIHHFTAADGLCPQPRLAVGEDGTLYGATLVGGANDAGVVFGLALSGIGPNVLSISPSSGSRDGGTDVTIGINEIQNTASVSIGGFSATNVAFPDPATITATTPRLGSGTLNDVAAMNPDGTLGILQEGWFADFVDMRQGDIFHDHVEKLVRHHVTVGCGGGNYCRDSSLTRSQAAVFLLKAEHGGGYNPPPCTGLFTDVECTPTPAFAVDWIEQLYSEGITSGCGGGNYCPSSPLRRDQMAVLLLRALHGSAYVPPSCTGIFADVSCTPAPAFAVDWIEELYHEGVTGGCSTNPLSYCPSALVTRGQMAPFLVRTFSLQ